MALRDTFLMGTAALALSLALGTADAATPADTLVMAKQIDDLITLDPGEAFENSGYEFDAQLYDRVIGFDAADTSKIAPAATESYTISDNGKTITFKVRDAKFASGAPVTATDIAWSLQRAVKMNKTPGFILTQLGWDAGNVERHVKALDARTLQLFIPEDFAPSFVLNALSANVTGVVEKAVVEKNAKDGDFGNEWLKTHSAGSGPFTLRSLKPNDNLVMDANPNYWRGAPKIKRVVIRHVPETATQRLLLEKGDVDIARNLSGDQIAGLAANKEIVVEGSPNAYTYYMGLNQKDERLRNPKVREAIRWLVDYQGMASTILKGTLVVDQAFWPAGFDGALTENPFKLDVAKAKALLAEAGYPNGFEINLDAYTVFPYANIAQSLQSTLGQAGIKVNIISGEQRQVITKYRARNHQMVFLSWFPDFIDPHSNADTFAQNVDNSDNAKAKPVAWRNAWDIPELSGMTQAAARELDTDKRMAMYVDIQKKVQADGALVMMFQGVDQNAIRANVKGFVGGPVADMNFYRLVTK